MSFITDPAEIEKESFARIAQGLGDRQFDPRNLPVLKRVIHTTADFDYADNLVFSEGAVEAAKNALRKGAAIVTDTQMARAGINKQAVEKLRCSLHCFIDAPEVAQAALANGSTRAKAAVDHAAQTLGNGPVLFVSGNAPTALIRVHELVESGKFLPALIVGVPVGFVNVVESKELILGLPVPYIVARGRKGGSNVAAAIVNALLYDETQRVL